MRSGRFVCEGCGTHYTVVKRKVPPEHAQRCAVCELVFPAKDAGDWLRYYRVAPPGSDAA
jgi:hypothetical protein